MCRNGVAAILKQSDSFILCAGELIHKSYIDDFLTQNTKKGATPKKAQNDEEDWGATKGNKKKAGKKGGGNAAKSKSTPEESMETHSTSIALNDLLART
uniref:Uncharacterized protein n=1 Tax=Ditylenchus dipsaci TaxID=166011 RepID=A0A915E6G3_9BILA